MAKLFGGEYHEHSNSWYFKSTIINLKKDDLTYKKYLDENENVVFDFTSENRKIFSAKVEIVYDKNNKIILNQKCSECSEEFCKHFLSVINYSYKYLTTDILEKSVIQTYQTKLLDYNEYWQRVVLNAKIEVANIFNQETDKIRFSLKSYLPMNIRLISILLAQKNCKEEDIPEIPKAKKQLKALSDEEINLLILLQNKKCAFSRKGVFFSIYKDDFIHFFQVLKSLQNKIYIKETGDRFLFSSEEFRINFQVIRAVENDFILKISRGEQISAFFVGKTTYIFKKNEIFSINLPFSKDVTTKLFQGNFKVKKEDLVYLASVVARQLGLIKCYLDFASDITIPKVYHNTPIITFELKKENKQIIMDGILDYENGIEIPMSLIRFPAELVRFDQDGEVAWFYIPPQTKYQIFNFVQRLPESQTNRLEENSQLVFEGDENITILKETIFEFTDPSWNIILSEDLKKEFVYKVHLEPMIKAKASGKIDWFEYEVKYQYKDVDFTHEELRKFFTSKKKFMKLDDGRMLFFENKESFLEVEKLLQKSEKLPSEAYKLSVYNLPYIYQLSSINKAIKIFGDDFLEEMFYAILKRKLSKEPQLASFLKPIMRSYQKAGYQWLKMLQNYHLSGILADDMGLGKTIQAISVLSDLPQNAKSIVICPKTLLFNWAAEIEKFNKNLTFIIYEGNQKERKKILENLNVNILFTSYSIIQNDIKQLSEIEFEFIILDEAQHIKNASALRTKAVKKLRSRNKMALSGTPIENSPTELWSIFDFLMPGYLPPLRRFKNEFLNQDDEKRAVQDKLKMLISPFILRRKKRDVLIELPDKQVQIAYCKMTEIQEKMYLQILENVKQGLLQPTNRGYFIHILAALTRLRQICNHPILIDKNVKPKSEFSGKIELLQEIISDALESGKKLLIFSQFVQMLKVLKDLTEKMKIPYEYMDGSTINRQKRIDNFNNNNNIRIFLISFKTGGFGLNLIAADTVIIVDPWWNPMGEDQAIDRAHRIGQTKKVNVYKIITKGTIEEKILTLQQSKREMFEHIIEDGQNIIKNMNSEQLRKLLEY